MSPMASALRLASLFANDIFLHATSRVCPRGNPRAAAEDANLSRRNETSDLFLSLKKFLFERCKNTKSTVGEKRVESACGIRYCSSRDIPATVTSRYGTVGPSRLVGTCWLELAGWNLLEAKQLQVKAPKRSGSGLSADIRGLGKSRVNPDFEISPRLSYTAKCSVRGYPRLRLTPE